MLKKITFEKEGIGDWGFDREGIGKPLMLSILLSL